MGLTRRWKERRDRMKARSAEAREAEYERLAETNIRPYLVTRRRLPKLAEIGGFDIDKLTADYRAAKEAGTNFYVHLNPADVRAAGGLPPYAGGSGV